MHEKAAVDQSSRVEDDMVLLFEWGTGFTVRVGEAEESGCDGRCVGC